MSTEYPQYMHSKQLNAPQMNGEVGAEGQILQVLDACLTTGFNPQTVATATIVGEEIKLDFGVMHGYEILQHITISGGSSSELNAKHRILKVTGTTVTIAKGTIASVAGTLTTKIASLNWENMFGVSDTKRRAYRSKDITSKKQVLFLDCNYAEGAAGVAVNPFKGARVSVCESMDVLGAQGNSLTDPTNLQAPSGLLHWFQKVTTHFQASANTGFNTPWLLIGDGKIFYFLVGWGSYGTATAMIEEKCIYMFGELPKITENDNFNSVIAATYLNPHGYSSSSTVYNSQRESFTPRANELEGASGVFYLQDITGSARLEPVKFAALSGLTISSSYQFSGATSPDMPVVHPLTLGFVLTEGYFMRQGSKSFGAALPYLRFICADVKTLGTSLDRTVHNGVLIVRTASQYASNYAHVYYAHVGFDLTSPRPKDAQI